MKILHVIPNFHAIGGAEMMLSRLILSRSDCEHAIVALINDVDDTFAQAAAQCRQVTALHWNGINTLSVIKQLKNLIQKYQPDVVQGWMYHANVLSTLACKGLKDKPKLVWGIHHSLTSPKDESLSTKISLRMSRALTKHCDAIVYCAHSALEQHKVYGFRHPKQMVIANGIQIEQFQINETLHSPITIGFAGRYHAAKGYQYLFETIALLQDQPLKFRIAGKGANFNNPDIQQWIKALQINPHQLELLDQVRDMASFYQSVDVFLMTSITEGLPTVLIEAMASGVPCISTDVGDATNIVQDIGWIVASRQPEQLKNAIITYLNLPDQEKKQLKLAARQQIEQRFALSQVSQHYLTLWESL
ncbi:glycosyltransferase [Acinetobacter qingfengensis]|uniref:Glycosyltransferase subfamily 4-like N-terminal domain-containing protein n=1 Tax=Acinetobacter qingfengensis TaxID=1262585 RepID=A0A1E7RD02_9GAMM|nr:glycosyltransferase [Acinetobacter qingfengensis]KAA8732076.1 glycosyltransferase [Acinetobacter qingfengensis]OEY97156.1 hypothetical protein BJI46_01630 [Acinetobacter qingfengensis]